MMDWARSFATSAIWLAIGYALGNGLFKMKFSGESSLIILLFVPIILLVGAILGTRIVWMGAHSNIESEKAPNDSIQ
jgi:hypothetical protein